MGSSGASEASHGGSGRRSSSPATASAPLARTLCSRSARAVGEGPVTQDAPGATTLLDVGLQVVDAHPDVLEVAPGLRQPLLRARELEHDPAGGLAHVGAADVGHQLVALGERVDDRLLDQFLGEGEPDLLPLHRTAPFVGALLYYRPWSCAPPPMRWPVPAPRSGATSRWRVSA